MQTVLTMELKGNYRTFTLFSDGTAKENGKRISDFGSFFEGLSDIGYKIVAETNIPQTESKGNANIISFPSNGRETFRSQWEAYLCEYSDNLECEFSY